MTERTKEDPTDSPLSTADPMALEELIARNPGDLTPSDMEAHLKVLIPRLRALRKEAEKRDNAAHRSGKWGKGAERSLPDGVETLDELFED